MNKPLMTTKTGGFTLLSILLLVGAVFLLVLQGIALASGEAEGGVTRFLPGGLAVLLGVFFFLGTRNGSLEILAEGIKGKTAGGKQYELGWEEIGKVEPAGKKLVVRNQEGKVLVVDKVPRYRKSLGLIWLLKKYPYMQPEKWPFYDIQEDAPQNRPIRYFDEGEKASFGDRGFLFRYDDKIYYFPVSQTTPSPPVRGEAQTPPTLAAAQPTVPRMEPNPAFLPLESVWKAVSTAESDRETVLKLLEEWMVEHGGCQLEEAPEDIDAEFVGQVGEYLVRVSRPARKGS